MASHSNFLVCTHFACVHTNAKAGYVCLVDAIAVVTLDRRPDACKGPKSLGRVHGTLAYRRLTHACESTGYMDLLDVHDGDICTSIRIEAMI